LILVAFLLGVNTQFDYVRFRFEATLQLNFNEETVVMLLARGVGGNAFWGRVPPILFFPPKFCWAQKNFL